MGGFIRTVVGACLQAIFVGEKEAATGRTNYVACKQAPTRRTCRFETPPNSFNHMRTTGDHAGDDDEQGQKYHAFHLPRGNKARVQNLFRFLFCRGQKGCGCEHEEKRRKHAEKPFAILAGPPHQARHPSCGETEEQEDCGEKSAAFHGKIILVRYLAAELN